MAVPNFPIFGCTDESYGYIQNYRINRAMALLRTSTLTIADVAEEAGFGSPQAFSRIFKKETSYTPRAYRKL